MQLSAPIAVPSIGEADAQNARGEFAPLLAEHPERRESLATELTNLYLRLLGVEPGENG